MFSTSIFLLTVLSSVNAAEKVENCDVGNNDGLKAVLGDVFELGTGYDPVHHPQSTKYTPGKWNILEVEYVERRKNYFGEVFGYHIVTYSNGFRKVIDHLRVQPKRWQNLANAIMGIEEPQGDNRILKIKYLMDDCECVMRKYNLYEANAPGTAETFNCDGTALLASKHVKLTAKNPQVPGCERGFNPGIYRFDLALPMSTRIHAREPLPSASDIKDFLIFYGRCNKKAAITTVIPVSCYGILYKTRRVEISLSKPYEDTTGSYKAKGYDYTTSFYIYPVTQQGTTEQLKIKFLMDDCTCQVRIYTVPTNKNEKITGVTDTAPCDTVESSAGLWSQPVLLDADPKQGQQD